MTGETGTVFNIQKFSINDGPGIRTTVFLKGCPLRCKWCHNPESNEVFPQLMLHENLCVGCGRCVHVCPLHCIGLKSGKSITDRSRCIGCGQCVSVCTSNARELAGKQEGVEDVIRIVAEDEMFYRSSGGGMTVSGGEPLMQPAFTAALMKAAHEKGIHTALETSGFASRDAALSVFAHADLILFDIKHMDETRHRVLTGASNRQIHRNLFGAVQELGRDVWIRMPLIAGINDQDSEMDAVTALLHPLQDHIRRICLLSYHNLGLSKLEALDYATEEMRTFRSPAPERMEQLADQFRRRGYFVTID